MERQIVPAFFLSSLHVPAEDGEDDAGVAHDGEERDGAEAGSSRVRWRKGIYGGSGSSISVPSHIGQENVKGIPALERYLSGNKRRARAPLLQ